LGLSGGVVYGLAAQLPGLDTVDNLYSVADEGRLIVSGDATWTGRAVAAGWIVIRIADTVSPGNVPNRRVLRGAGNGAELHHSLAKFLGGEADQLLSRLPRSTHQELHGLLSERLKAAGMPRVGGGIGGSTLDWQRYMRASPGVQRQALDILLDVSREVGQRHGTHITTDLWDNLLNGRFTSYP
jgi:hypothetical protein